MKRSLQDDAYRHALSVSWPVFFALWGTVFVGLNAAFAGLYSLGGDGVAGARPGSFGDLFFFSVETFATIGFGEMVPRSTYVRIVATAESFTSISSVALATGLIFTRFSRPDARIVFAPMVAFATIAGTPTLMVKLGNRRRDAIIEASARLWLIRSQSFEGVEGRRFVELPLDKPDHPIVLDAWTLFHTIGAASPLHGLDETALRAAGASLLVTFRGTDERTAQTVIARREYVMAEAAWNRRFEATPDLRHRAGACLEFGLVDVAPVAGASGCAMIDDASADISAPADQP